MLLYIRGIFFIFRIVEYRLARGVAETFEKRLGANQFPAEIRKYCT